MLMNVSDSVRSGMVESELSNLPFISLNLISHEKKKKICQLLTDDKS